jgi:hypothetical protein
MHGTADHTSGGLTKRDLKYNRRSGRIVSRRKSARARKLYSKYREEMKEGRAASFKRGNKMGSRSHRRRSGRRSPRRSRKKR